MFNKILLTVAIELNVDMIDIFSDYDYFIIFEERVASVMGEDMLQVSYYNKWLSKMRMYI